MRIIAAAFILLCPHVAAAQSIPVRSGEHPGFSRVVVQFPEAPQWQFGHVEGGFELRTDAAQAKFDLADVFRKIGRKRITSVMQPGPGRLVLGSACECDAQAFEIRPGRIVVDIGRLPTAPTALPTLSPLPSGAGWTEEGEGTFEHTLDSPAKVGASPDPGDSANAKRDDDKPNAPRQDDSKVPEGNGSLALSGALGNVDRSAEPKVANSNNAPTAPEEGNRRASDRPKKADSAPQQIAGLPKLRPTAAAQLFVQSADDGTLQLHEMRTQLVRQLSRAFAQGVVDLKAVKLAPRADDGSPGSHAEPEHHSKRESAKVAENVSLQTHIAAETVIDRDNAEPHPANELTENGDRCLPEEHFDVASWGTPSDPADSALPLPAPEIVEEFDRPDSEQALSVARQYIFLGFGAEARNVLDAFSVSGTSADIARQIAEVVDDRVVSHAGPLLQQTSCSTAAAMWAFAALDNPAAARNVDTRAVVRAFSALPGHLRRRLGPWLVENFLARHETAQATAIRDAMQRGSQDAGTEFLGMTAAIADENGDTPRAVEALRKSSQAPTPDLPAIVRLQEIVLEKGKLPDARDIALLAGYAREYRGTDLGRRIYEVLVGDALARNDAARALSLVAAARVETWKERAWLDDLEARAQLVNSRASPDETFVELVLRYPPPAKPGALWEEVRLALADRLSELGLAHASLAMLEPVPDSPQARELRARTVLHVGNPEEALKILEGDNSTAAIKLKARANESVGRLGAAAAFYLQVGKMQAAASALWRNGAKATLLEQPQSRWSAAVRYAIGQSQSVQLTDGGQNFKGSVEQRQYLNEARSALARSSELKKAIQAVLGM